MWRNQVTLALSFPYHSFGCNQVGGSQAVLVGCTVTGMLRIAETDTRPLVLWASITGSALPQYFAHVQLQRSPQASLCIRADLGILVNDGARPEFRFLRLAADPGFTSRQTRSAHDIGGAETYLQATSVEHTVGGGAEIHGPLTIVSLFSFAVCSSHCVRLLPSNPS
eukprot:SAG31_NODE_374_length_16577_cov_9.902173_3_plen_167_part_00